MVVRPPSPAPLVPHFYARKKVLVTGATGFMGKVLVERLLWTCPELDRIYVLLRPKRGAAPTDRLAQLKQSPIFSNIVSRDPRQLDKLVVVPGDVSQSRLGLDADGVAMLQDVSLVFHCAASLRFEEPLGAAVAQNVRSVERMLELCDELPHMEVFMHVSTAYSNAELSSVEERVYTAPRPLHHVHALVHSMPERLLAEVTPQYIAPKPNTYTFTKALAETVIQEHGNSGYPVAIFRPTVVVSSLRHPFPGWVENLNGPSGVVVGAGKGLMRVVSARPDARADMLPVDIAIDTLITAAWDMATDRPDEVRVYNCSTCSNPTTWRQFQRALERHLQAHPFDGVLWYPVGICVENIYTQKVLETLLQTVPLYAADYIANILGIKTKLSLIKANQRLKAMNDVLRFFSTREWHFHTDNVRRLQAKLSPEDAAIYNLDPHSIVWNDLYENFVKGTRKYILQEKDEDIDDAKKHLRRMFYVHYGVIMFVVLLLCRLALHNDHIRSFVYRTLRMLFTLSSYLFTNKRS